MVGQGGKASVVGFQKKAGVIKRVPEQARDSEKDGLGLEGRPRDPQRIGHTQNLAGAGEEDT